MSVWLGDAKRAVAVVPGLAVDGDEALEREARGNARAGAREADGDPVDRAVGGALFAVDAGREADVRAAVAARPGGPVVARIAAVALEVELAVDHAGRVTRLLVDPVHQERPLLGVGDAGQQQHA